MWNIEYTYIEKWLDTLDDVAISMIFAALERLQEEGPNLGSLLVDTLSNTEVKNLKELRPVSPKGSEIRIIFCIVNFFLRKRAAVEILRTLYSCFACAVATLQYKSLGVKITRYKLLVHRLQCLQY